MIIIGFNGPPSSGKDTLAKMLHKEIPNSVVLNSQNILVKRPVHVSFGLNGIADDAFEKFKDKPHDLFFGLTPRQAYINHSELYMKNLYGKDILSKLMVRKIIQQEHFKITTVIFPSVGFQEEVDLFVEYYPLCILRVSRQDTSFKNDSRMYVTHDWLYEIDNNKSLDTMNQIMKDIASVIMEHMIKLKKPPVAAG